MLIEQKTQRMHQKIAQQAIAQMPQYTSFEIKRGSKMKILRIISTGYPAGGAENGVVKIHSHLLAKGHTVKILASDLGPDKEHFNDYSFKSINSANPATLLLFLFNPSSFLVLRRVLEEYQPDIVHLHTMHQVTPSVLFLLKKYPTVMTLHGPETYISKLIYLCIRPIDSNYYYDNGKFNLMGRLSLIFNYIQNFIYKLAIKNIDLFIAPSRFMQSTAECDLSPIIHLPNFVDLRKFYELKNNYNLLFVGRVEKVKGIEYLIKAMSLIINVFPEATLTIVGDGFNKQNLLNLTNSLQLDKHIKFVGWVNNKNLDEYYEKASIVVVPSTWPENFGVVALEAMITGRPVIASRIGGLPEFIDDGLNGYLIEPQNSEQIAEKAIKLFSDEALLKQFGENAHKKAETFSIERYTDNMIKVYEDVLTTYKLHNHLTT